MELLNYLNFCCSIPRPPNKSIMSLEMRFDKINCKFQSLKEIPTSDYCIEVLFDVLEISVIIKLFIALLFEKQIIIVSNQNMLLFCICEAILRLIFPFRWLYTYIPNLPKEKNEILEMNRPYLIGIISEKTTAIDLNNKYPSNIICDVNCSILYGNITNLKLPYNEEMKIKTKLLLLRDKFKNNYDEFDLDENVNDYSKKESIDKYEDVDFDLSFAENVHNIFFKIFKNNLMDIKKDYIANDVFESQKFLDSFDDEEYKLFFEKIIVTSAFDYFISSMKFLDNSLSSRFNLIYNFADTRLKGKIKKINYYKYSLSIPKKLKLIELEENINISTENKEKNTSYIFNNYNEISKIMEENSEKYLQNSGNTISDYLKIKNNNGTNRKNSYINFYGKNGFIEFAKDYNDYINYNNIIKEEVLILYKNIYSKDTIDEVTNIINVQNKDSYQFFLLIALFLYNYLSEENDKKKKSDKDNKENNNNFNINQKQKIINPRNNKDNSNRQILFLSNYKGNEINKGMIFDLFLKAYMKNQDEFPRNLFITILKIFTLNELRDIKQTNLKYIDKTIQFQILKIQKISYESMVIKDTDNDFINKKENQNNNLTLTLVKSGDNASFQTDIYGKRYSRRRKTSMHEKYTFLNKLSSTPKNEIESKDIKNNEIEIDKEESQENFQKTKLNVLGDNKNNESNETIIIINKSGNQQKNNKSKPKYSTMKNIYKLRKRDYSGLKSWNNIKLSNNLFQSQSISLKSNLFLDPMVISEKICIKLYKFLYTKKIENFTEKNNDINFLRELSHSNAFDEIKNLILSLKYISLDNLSTSKNKYYCFWLNIYNFLTIFSIIYKCEIVSNLYEWLRFLKNSYFTIGNVDISLLEIEAYILRNENIINNIYGISINNDQLKLPNIDKYNFVINFGISLPTISSPDLRVYYPTNFFESLKYNATLFFSKNLKINIQNGNIEIPEYINMIEPNFNFNMETFNDYFEKDFLKIINENPSFKIITKKFNWNLNFADFKNF